MSANNKKQGVVKLYDKERAFGFIQENNGYRNFFHISSCRGFVPEIGQEVTFNIGTGRKGPAAVDVELVSPISTPVKPVSGVQS
jgi:cold shock CspA family protein